MTVVAGLAEFERQLARTRSAEGRARAVARGQHMGRPPTLTPDQRENALRAFANGTATQADLARQCNVSQSTISRLVAAANLPPASSFKLKIDPATERATRTFLDQFRLKYPVREAILFGSRARGDHTPDSDADLAVVLEGEHGDRAAVSMDMAGLAFNVMMKTGVMVQGLPLWDEDMKMPERFSNPALIENILREGIHL